MGLIAPFCCDCCRGKLLNVRDASAAQISANTEIQNIKQILGLQHGKVGWNQERSARGIQHTPFSPVPAGVTCPGHCLSMPAA